MRARSAMRVSDSGRRHERPQLRRHEPEPIRRPGNAAATSRRSRNGDSATNSGPKSQRHARVDLMPFAQLPRGSRRWMRGPAPAIRSGCAAAKRRATTPPNDMPQIDGAIEATCVESRDRPARRSCRIPCRIESDSARAFAAQRKRQHAERPASARRPDACIPNGPGCRE